MYDADKALEIMMRKHEEAQSYRIPDNHWITLRLDGRNFSALTEQHFTKPFDLHFQEAMVVTAKIVVMELQACYAHVGSDEISLIFPPACTTYDRRAEKLLSMSAGIASSIFTLKTRTLAQFDSRINIYTTVGKVVLYCLWRCADVQRNNIATLAYWTLRREGFSGRQAAAQVKEAPRQTKREMLEQRGIPYETLPEWQREGVAITWETDEKQSSDPIEPREALASRRRVAERPVNGNHYSTWLQSYLETEAMKYQEEHRPQTNP